MKLKSHTVSLGVIKMKILLIDDDMIFLTCLKQEMENNGDDVKITASPVEALKYFKNEGFDVVITDLNMPFVSGIDLMKIFHKIDKKTIVIVMSSSDDDNTKKSVLNSGAYSFMSKQSISVDLPEILKKLIQTGCKYV
jgi:DNA-binding NarL/FixJ family response regulator